MKRTVKSKKCEEAVTSVHSPKQYARAVSVTQPTKWMSQKCGAKCTNDIISYCARVSNPSNQGNFDTAEKLLTYCMRKRHWSIFEMVDVTFELFTTRDIGRQILRHDASFQEFSQRYAKINPNQMFIREARLQDDKNRQNSIMPSDNKLQKWWDKQQQDVIKYALKRYEAALKKGMAKECARVVLPEGNTPSTMYMKNSLRNWIHYCLVRKSLDTQKEHREIATMIWNELKEHFDWLEAVEETI